MDHICIRCHYTWLPEHEEANGQTTADLCERCLTVWVRSKQKAAGLHDCFKRATELCSRKDCMWFQMCCEEFLVDDMLERK